MVLVEETGKEGTRPVRKSNSGGGGVNAEKTLTGIGPGSGSPGGGGPGGPGGPTPPGGGGPGGPGGPTPLGGGGPGGPGGPTPSSGGSSSGGSSRGGRNWQFKWITKLDARK